MVPTVSHREKEALDRRFETIGWGLFLIILGAIWLVPDERMPEGTWLIAAGVIMLGMNVARYLNDIPLSGTTIVLGILAVLLGVGAWVGVDVPVFPLLLILFGASMILRPWIDPLFERQHS